MPFAAVEASHLSDATTPAGSVFENRDRGDHVRQRLPQFLPLISIEVKELAVVCGNVIRGTEEIALTENLQR